MSLSVARRMALAAQGFTDQRPTGAANRRHLRRVLSRVQLIQLDSVNVAVRAHYAPLFARLGAYDTALIDDAAWSDGAGKPRLLCEHWAHEASLLPIDDWPFVQSEAKRRGDSSPFHDVLERSPALVDDVLSVVKELGPIGAGAIERELVGVVRQTQGTWWDRSDVKMVCEWLFAVGQLTTGSRKGFERLYELTERVLPPQVLSRTVGSHESARELVSRAATALGVATEPDLRDYYRLRPASSKRAVAELVEGGVLEEVRVQGWRASAYRHVGARVPRRVTGRALLCPFDPLVWNRSRTERLFDFYYRIEIYVPEHKRVHGYYVYPFLLDGQLVARVDLKADRARGVLRVPGAFAEQELLPNRPVTEVAAELAAELRLMADWLGLSDVATGQRGDLAAPLRQSLRSTRS